MLFQSDMALMTGMKPQTPPGTTRPEHWRVHVLGVARAGLNHQGGDSGETAAESQNWNMIHASRGAGAGLLTLMWMSSLEPATISKRGSPQLFQTGEAYRGDPLVDRQHPHDFFMNLSATYRVPLWRASAIWFQAAPVGEPAIGPTAFMHRASAGENPASPLGHHWQDATHITFNVLTLGAGVGWLALEGSAFHGAEPDDQRWDIEGGPLDSAAGRVRILGGAWSAQASFAFLEDPEALDPGDTHRSTASIHYGARGDGPFAATALWGRNDEAHGQSDAFLLETAWQLGARDHLYARAEDVEKDRDLLLTKQGDEEAGAHTVVRVRCVTFGYLRDFPLAPGFRTGLGGDLTAYDVPESLQDAYGERPLSVRLFFRVRWGEQEHAHGGH